MKDNIWNVLALLLVALYVLSPVDCVPGPVDDLLLVILCLRGGKGLPF